MLVKKRNCTSSNKVVNNKGSHDLNERMMHQVVKREMTWKEIYFIIPSRGCPLQDKTHASCGLQHCWKERILPTVKKLVTRIMIYKSNWFLFSTRFKGGFFQYPVLVTLRSPLGPDQSSTRHSYGALRVSCTSTRQCFYRLISCQVFCILVKFLAKTAN